MSKITVSLEPQFLKPTLDVYKEYFDNKYPCTDEYNDGSDMPLEDEVRFATYNYLLNIYENGKEIYIDAYNELKKKVSDLEVS